MDNKGQMMVLESVLFSISVILSTIFLIQLSPTSINVETDNNNGLELVGKNVLSSLYNQKVDISDRGQSSYIVKDGTKNNPIDSLSVFIICNNYNKLKEDINEYLSSDSIYFNLYITNGDGSIDPVFICSSNGIINPLQTIDPVVTSSFYISIDPVHLTDYPSNIYDMSETPAVEVRSNIASVFLDILNYEGATYQLILELWEFKV